MDNEKAPAGQVHKTLSNLDYFNVGFGSIVGIGWILMVGDWVVLGGGPLAAMIAFFLGGIALLPIAACFGELATALPISGGIVEYVERAFGQKASFLAGWLLAFGDGIVCPWEALAITTIMTELVSAYCILFLGRMYIFIRCCLVWPQQAMLFCRISVGRLLWPNCRNSSRGCFSSGCSLLWSFPSGAEELPIFIRFSSSCMDRRLKPAAGISARH